MASTVAKNISDLRKEKEFLFNAMCIDAFFSRKLTDSESLLMANSPLCVGIDLE